MYLHSQRKIPKYFYTGYFLLALIILTIFTVVFWKVPPEMASRLASYTQVLTIVIFTVTGIVTVQNFKAQMEDRERTTALQYNTISQGKTGDIDKTLMNNQLLDRLYFQMYAHDPHIRQIAHPIQPTPEIIKAEHQASNLIFQKVADIYASEGLKQINRDNVEWVITFRHWFQSPILRGYWSTLKKEQHPDVQKFVDQVLINQENRKHKEVKGTKKPVIYRNVNL